MRHGTPRIGTLAPPSRRLPFALVALLALAAGPGFAQLVPAGGPWLLEGPYNPVPPWEPPLRLLVHPEGGFLALWQRGAPDDAHVFGRRFNDSGPVGAVLDFGPGYFADAVVTPAGEVLLSDRERVRRRGLDGRESGPAWAFDDGWVDGIGERYGHSAPGLAIDPSGDILVAWSVYLQYDEPLLPPFYFFGHLLVRRFDSEGRPLGSSQRLVSGTDVWGPEVSALGDGAFLVTVLYDDDGNADLEGGLRLLVGADGSVQRLEQAPDVWAVRTAVGPGGRSLSVYTESGYGYQSADGDCTGAFGLLADRTGDLGSGPIDLPRDRSDCQWQARAAATPDGFVVGWQTDRPQDWAEGPTTNPFHGVSLRRLDRDGRPLGDPLDLRFGGGAFRTFPGQAALADLAFADGRAAVLGVGGTGIWAALAAPVPAGPCRPGADHLCLGGATGDRFRVDLSYVNPYAGDAPGRGFAHPLTADTGAFWLFAPDNLELVVKVLDGRAVNGRFWVLAGAATTVEWWLIVTDTATGEQWGRSVSPYRLATVADTAALPRPASPADPGPSVVPGPGLVGTGEEVELGGRYRLRVTWTDPWSGTTSGTSGVGRGRAVTGDTALFWFFHPANVELLVKVLDGRAVNGHAWVLWGSLTGVAFELEVEDTVSGRTQIYRNEPFHLGGGADTVAFP